MVLRFQRWLQDGLRSLLETRVGQIPALDGIRTLAITLVILGYSKNDLVHAGSPRTPEWLFTTVGFGWTGVDLFFVLSGFLIGRLLFQEVQKTGTVAVGRFLLKRGLRIWPLYYFVCGVMLTKMLMSNHLPTWGDILPDFVFLTNFFKETLVYGSWSLSVEEQFYLIGAVMILFSRGLVRTAAGKITHFLTFLLFLVPFARSAVWNHFAGHQAMDLNYLEWEILHSYIFTHCDGLLIGMTFASLVVFRQSEVERDSPLRRWMKPALIALTAASGVATYFDPILFKYTFVTFVFGTLVWHCVTRPEGEIARMFSWPGFQVISRLSYGMYIWYRFPLWRIASFVRTSFPEATPAVHLWTIFVIAFAFAVFTAGLTYLLIERPFLQWRDHWLSGKPRPVPAPAVKTAPAQLATTPAFVMENANRDPLDYT